MFNRLSGEELSPVGVRRPTTSAAQAAVWGEASGVVDWLGVARRHGLSDPALEGLVLLDLPDHDSTQVEHRLEVDRLVELVDVLVWVVDPQKYADAALHYGYLRPLATHAPVSIVVLNQADRLSETQRGQCLSHLSRLLREEGLSRAQVLCTSSVTGEGLDSLKEVLRARVREQQAAAERLSADLDKLAASLAPLCEGEVAGGPGRPDRERLIDALAFAAGVGAVVDAVGRSHRRDAGLATGWPFTRWLRRLRPDPLGRLHLRRAGEGGRTSLPEATPLQTARMENALRRVADSAGTGLPAPWADTLKQTVAPSTAQLPDELDTVVSSTNLGEDRRPLWWGFARGMQTLLATIAILGFAWLALLFALEWFQVPRPPTPRVRQIPWPTLAAVGGLLAGLVLSTLFGQLARLGAARRRRRAGRRLREQIEQIADQKVLAPIETELRAFRQFCAALRVLRTGRR